MKTKLKTQKIPAKKLSLTDIRQHLDDLDNLRTIVTNFEKDSFFNNQEVLRTLDFQLPLKIKSLHSEIKDCEEINEKLESLSFNLGILRTTLLTKNYKEAVKISKKFIDSDYSKLTQIVDEINYFQKKIDELEESYNSLLKSIPSNLDFKLEHEPKIDNHIASLKDINQKQKIILSGIGGIFLELTKRIIESQKEEL